MLKCVNTAVQSDFVKRSNDTEKSPLPLKPLYVVIRHAIYFKDGIPFDNIFLWKFHFISDALVQNTEMTSNGQTMSYRVEVRRIATFRNFAAMY